MVPWSWSYFSIAPSITLLYHGHHLLRGDPPQIRDVLWRYYDVLYVQVECKKTSIRSSASVPCMHIL